MPASPISRMAVKLKVEEVNHFEQFSLFRSACRRKIEGFTSCDGPKRHKREEDPKNAHHKSNPSAKQNQTKNKRHFHPKLITAASFFFTFTPTQPIQANPIMKIFLTLLTATAVAADHTSLRHATTERVLTEAFDQQAIVDAAENDNRNEPCIPGEFDQNALVINAQRKQFPQDVPVDQQCR